MAVHARCGVFVVTIEVFLPAEWDGWDVQLPEVMGAEVNGRKKKHCGLLVHRTWDRFAAAQVLRRDPDPRAADGARAVVLSGGSRWDFCGIVEFFLARSFPADG